MCLRWRNKIAKCGHMYVTVIKVSSGPLKCAGDCALDTFSTHPNKYLQNGYIQVNYDYPPGVSMESVPGLG